MRQTTSPPYTYDGNPEDHKKDAVAIITTGWHAEIINVLYDGALEVLNQNGVTEITRFAVPGSFELPFAARLAADTGKYDGIICLGCIIKGETQHDEFIAHAVTQSLAMLSAAGKIPVLLGLLTTLNIDQAWDRAGGAHGHKGKECAIGLLQLLDLKRQFSNARTASGFRFA